MSLTRPRRYIYKKRKISRKRRKISRKRKKTYKRRKLQRKKTKRRRHRGGSLNDNSEHMACLCDNGICTCVYKFNNERDNLEYAKQINDSKKAAANTINSAINRSINRTIRERTAEFYPGTKVQHKGGPPMISKWLKEYKESSPDLYNFFERSLHLYKYSQNNPYYILLKRIIDNRIAKWYIVYGHYDLYKMIKTMSTQELHERLDTEKKTFQIQVDENKYKIVNLGVNLYFDRNDHNNSNDFTFFKREEKKTLGKAHIKNTKTLNLRVELIPEFHLELFDGDLELFKNFDLHTLTKEQLNNTWYIVAHGSPVLNRVEAQPKERKYSYSSIQDYVKLKEGQIVIMFCNPANIGYADKNNAIVFKNNENKNVLNVLDTLKKQNIQNYCVFKNSVPNIKLSFYNYDKREDQQLLYTPVTDDFFKESYNVHTYHSGLFKLPIKTYPEDPFYVTSEKYFDNYRPNYITKETTTNYQKDKPKFFLYSHIRDVGRSPPKNIQIEKSLRVLLQNEKFKDKPFVLFITACRGIEDLTHNYDKHRSFIEKSSQYKFNPDKIDIRQDKIFRKRLPTYNLKHDLNVKPSTYEKKKKIHFGRK